MDDLAIKKALIELRAFEEAQEKEELLKTKNMSFERTWKNTKKEHPKESGRYWCIVEEINDLGKTQYQWNCSYNKGEGVWYGENWKRMKVIYWTELAPYPL